MPISDKTRKKYNLPPRYFFYTLDQLADILGYTSVANVRKSLWYDGRDPGNQPNSRMRAVNVAASFETPEWRVEETEFVRWLSHMKIIPARRY